MWRFRSGLQPWSLCRCCGHPARWAGLACWRAHGPQECHRIFRHGCSTPRVRRDRIRMSEVALDRWGWDMALGRGMSTGRGGVLAAVTAFALWGLLPLFWKALEFLPPLVIVAQRTLWALVLLWIIILWRGCGREVAGFVRVDLGGGGALCVERLARRAGGGAGLMCGAGNHRSGAACAPTRARRAGQLPVHMALVCDRSAFRIEGLAGVVHPRADDGRALEHGIGSALVRSGTTRRRRTRLDDGSILRRESLRLNEPRESDRPTPARGAASRWSATTTTVRDSIAPVVPDSSLILRKNSATAHILRRCRGQWN